jgi:hypothetical protein
MAGGRPLFKLKAHRAREEIQHALSKCMVSVKLVVGGDYDGPILFRSNF